MCATKTAVPLAFGFMLRHIIRQDITSTSVYVLKKKSVLRSYETVEILLLLSCLLHINGFVLTQFK
jgi:hypothetical protein